MSGWIRIILAAACLIAQAVIAQERSVTITEPGVYEVADLYKSADAVALVKIAAGDTESYPTAIYRAHVVKGFKGLADGETVYFGPFLGEKLGWEYVLFLRTMAKPVAPKDGAGGYGVVHAYEVFDQGYSSMEISYQCAFDGNEIAQQCDYGARVCTDYIRLPKGMRAYPPGTEDTPFGCRWVKKAEFVNLLDGLSAAKK